MLELKEITKVYNLGNDGVVALNGISVKFRENEFVSVLGPSGCGKTTLLNIIGGLDKYTSGDLMIDGKSTKFYKDIDWDSYRNSRIGFVFQNYNLIPHQTILGNVELALTLSGISKSERKSRAEEALKKVGLSDKLEKRPNQLSGGQLQRVAIARALVNDPHIILADEPTGALDSKTSVQIMELLKEIAADRLVIMVTHNTEIAEKYSTRIIKLLDGNIVGDSDPVPDDEEVGKDENIVETETADVKLDKEQKKRRKEEIKAKKLTQKKTSMSMFTAIALSFRNLMTKKGRTFITSFAGSIGIIGVALVLAISNGFSSYINKLETETLSGYPVSVSQATADVDAIVSTMQTGIKNDFTEFPNIKEMYVYDASQTMSEMFHINKIDEDFIEYIENIPDKEDLLNDVKYEYGVKMNILRKRKEGEIVKVTTPDNSLLSGGGTMDLTGTSDVFTEVMDNKEYVLSEYDLIDGSYPEDYTQLMLVVDKYNRVSTGVLKSLGINVTDEDNNTLEKISFEELKSYEFKLVTHDGWYGTEPKSALGMEYFSAPTTDDYEKIYNDTAHTITLKISGILRQKENTSFALYNTGLLYLPSLTQKYLTSCKESVFGTMQAENSNYLMLSATFDKVPLRGIPYSILLSSINKQFASEQEGAEPFTEDDIREFCNQLVGISEIPTAIYFYPKGFAEKTTLNKYLDDYNADKSKNDKIIYIDAVAIVGTTMEQMVDIIQYVLIAFAAVSLIVSSIMIGIITYVSVIERTKEIGVLRSLGARKVDISRVFNAETLIIGFTAGVIGVVLSYLLCIPINIIIMALAKGAINVNIAVLNPLHAVIMIFVSMALTLISGLIPASVAAKKDPVVALRTE